MTSNGIRKPPPPPTAEEQMKTAPRQMTQQPKRRNSSIILTVATITSIIAAVSIWHAYHGPTPFNVTTAIFTSLATAIELALVPYTRRNENKTAHYRNVMQQMANSRESPVE